MNIQFWKYLIAFVVGGGLVLLELFVLVLTGTIRYEAHMIGFGIMAVAICGLAVSIPLNTGNRVIHYDSAISGFIYILMNPIYYVLVIFLGARNPAFVGMLGGLTAFIVSAILALILCGTLPGRVFFTSWEKRLVGTVSLEDIDDDPSLPPAPDDDVFDIYRNKR